MLKLTLQTNLKCLSCVGSIRPALDAEPTVIRWEADLVHPAKLIRIEATQEASVDHITRLIGNAGFQATLVPTDELTGDEQAGDRLIEQAGDRLIGPDSSGPRVSTYRPLITVVAYVVGATLLFEFADGSWEWLSASQKFMGFFFLGFAFFKLLDIGSFADSFATYDVVARRSRLYALSYPAIEFILGLLFVTNTWTWIANVVTAVVMAVGLIGVVSAVREKQTIQCACLGTVFNLPMSSVTIIENSVMMLMATVMVLSE